jgi:hypothetical protein
MKISSTCTLEYFHLVQPERKASIQMTTRLCSGIAGSCGLRKVRPIGFADRTGLASRDGLAGLPASSPDGQVSSITSLY